MTTAVSGGVKLFLLNHGQGKHLASIFATSPKKGDVTKCTHFGTFAPFPGVNKIFLRIIQKQFESYIVYETPMDQAGLRKGRAAREQMANG